MRLEIKVIEASFKTERTCYVLFTAIIVQMRLEIKVLKSEDRYFHQRPFSFATLNICSLTFT